MYIEVVRPHTHTHTHTHTHSLTPSHTSHPHTLTAGCSQQRNSHGPWLLQARGHGHVPLSEHSFTWPPNFLVVPMTTRSTSTPLEFSSGTSVPTTRSFLEPLTLVEKGTTVDVSEKGVKTGAVATV